MKRLLLAVLLVVGLVATVGVGHAAGLQVAAGGLTSLRVDHPCTGQATARPSAPSGSTFTGVTVTLPSTACSGRLVKATVLSGTTIVVQGSVVVSGTTATLVVPAYTAGSSYTVGAVVDGWNLPTTWSYGAPPQPFTPGNSATVVQTIAWGAGGDPRCAAVTVTASTRQSALWLVNVNIAAAPFNGATTGYRLTSGQVAFYPSATPQNGVIGVVGTNNGWDNVTSSQTRTFTLCY